MPRVLGGSQGGGSFLMGEVPLYLGPAEGLDRDDAGERVYVCVRHLPAYDLYTTCIRLIYDLYTTYILLVYDLYTTCIRLIYDLYTTYTPASVYKSAYETCLRLGVRV